MKPFFARQPSFEMNLKEVNSLLPSLVYQPASSITGAEGCCLETRRPHLPAVQELGLMKAYPVLLLPCAGV